MTSEKGICVPGRSSWSTAILWLAALAAILWFGSILRLPSGGIIGGSDAAHLHAPVRAVQAEAYRAGRLPVWSFQLREGYPLLGYFEYMSAYPPNVLIALLCDVPLSITVFALLHLTLFGAGMFLLLRGEDVQPGIAAVGSAGMVPCLFFLLQWPNALATVTWLPVLLAALNRIEKSWRAAAAASIAIGFMLLAGSPQFACGGAVLAAAYACAKLKCSRDARYRIALRYALAVALGAGLAAIQVLPAWAFWRQCAPRHFTAHEALTGSMHVGAMAQAVFPFLIQAPQSGGTALVDMSGQPPFYFGIAPLVLLLIGGRRKMFGLVVAALLLVLALGAHTPIGAMMAQFSAARLFRQWGRYSVFALIALMVFACRAKLNAGRLRVGALVCFAIGCGMLIGIPGILLLLSAIAPNNTLGSWSRVHPQAFSLANAPVLVWGALWLGAALSFWHASRTLASSASILAMLALCDFSAMVWFALPFATINRPDTTELGRFLKAHATENYHVLIAQRRSFDDPVNLQPNLPLLAGIGMLNGYGYPYREASQYASQAHSGYLMNWAGMLAQWPKLQSWGIRYVVVPKAVESVARDLLSETWDIENLSAPSSEGVGDVRLSAAPDWDRPTQRYWALATEAPRGLYVLEVQAKVTQELDAAASVGIEPDKLNLRPRVDIPGGAAPGTWTTLRNVIWLEGAHTGRLLGSSSATRAVIELRGAVLRRVVGTNANPAPHAVLDDGDSVLFELPRPRPLVSADAGLIGGWRVESGRITFSVESESESFVQVNTSFDVGWKASTDGARLDVRRADGIMIGVAVPPGKHVVALEYEPKEIRLGGVVTALSAMFISWLGLLGKPARLSSR